MVKEGELPERPSLRHLIKAIQQALETDSSGSALVDAARAARHAQLAFVVTPHSQSEPRVIEVMPYQTACYTVAIRGVGLLIFTKREAMELRDLLTCELKGEEHV